VSRAKLRINGVEWTVIFRPVPKRYWSEGEALLGLTIPSERTIYVTPDCELARICQKYDVELEPMQAVLVHEILHAAYPDLDEYAIMRGEAAIMAALGLLVRDED
jgi:hypothetical protein